MKKQWNDGENLSEVRHRCRKNGVSAEEKFFTRVSTYVEKRVAGTAAPGETAGKTGSFLEGYRVPAALAPVRRSPAYGSGQTVRAAAVRMACGSPMGGTSHGYRREAVCASGSKTQLQRRKTRYRAPDSIIAENRMDGLPHKYSV